MSETQSPILLPLEAGASTVSRRTISRITRSPSSERNWKYYFEVLETLCLHMKITWRVQKTFTFLSTYLHDLVEILCFITIILRTSLEMVCCKQIVPLRPSRQDCSRGRGWHILAPKNKSFWHCGTWNTNHGNIMTSPTSNCRWMDGSKMGSSTSLDMKMSSICLMWVKTGSVNGILGCFEPPCRSWMYMADPSSCLASPY